MKNYLSLSKLIIDPTILHNSLLRYISFFYLAFLPTLLASSNIDSLKLQIKPAIQDSNQVKNYLKLGREYYYNGELDSAINYADKGNKIAGFLTDKKWQASSYNFLGTLYREKGIYDQALSYFLKSLSIAEENHLPRKIADAYNGIAIIYAIQKQTNLATSYYEKSLAIHKREKNESGEASIYNNIGLLYLSNDDSKALKLFLKALFINKKLNDDYNIAANSENIGLAYDGLKNYTTAITYYETALVIWKKRQDNLSVAINMGYIGKTLIHQQKTKAAIDTLKIALALAKKINALSTQRDLYTYLSIATEDIHDFKSSLEYYKELKLLNDSLINSEKTKTITEMQMNYSFNKIKARDSLSHQIEVAKKEVQIKNEKTYNFIYIIVLVCISLLLFFVFKGYKEKNAAHKIITYQKNIVDYKQKQIIDSINYAKHIQNAILVPEDHIKNYFPDNFIIYKPKDIVAGDFYFFEATTTHIFYAAADCTGHGVPGALISIVCSNALTRCVKEFNLNEPGEILDKARELIIEHFNKSSHDMKDGMDISLLSIAKSERQSDHAIMDVKWAGANNPLWYVNNNEIVEIKGNKQSIGQTDNPIPFATHTLSIKKGNSVYLFTDGYADQFGGPKGKKFKYKQLHALLSAFQANSMKEQQYTLTSTFENWKGELEQVDDVLIIGIKI